MKKLLSTKQKLFVCVIIIALLPTFGVLVWGIQKSIQSPELQASDWTHSPTPTLSPKD